MAYIPQQKRGRFVARGGYLGSQPDVPILVPTLTGSTVKDRLAALETRRAELEELLERPAPAEVVALHPSAATRYRKLVEGLQASLGNGEDTTERRGAREAFRQLVKAVRVTTREQRGLFNVDVEGDLAALLVLEKGGGITKEVGAGTGFEPVTFRL